MRSAPTSIANTGIACLLSLLVLFALPTPARAQLTWSTSVTIDSDAGQSLAGVSCPSAVQCTAVDGKGNEVTVDPQSPDDPSPVTVDPGQEVTAVACPVSTQCTLVTYSTEVTFNPQDPAPTYSVGVDGNGMLGLSCPTATQCTAVDFSGDEVTFDPKNPGSPTPVSIGDSPGLQIGAVIACPTVTQCTAVDDSGRETTFNPQSPGEPAPTTVDGSASLTSVACPTTAQCTAVDASGHEVTFDPASPGTPTAVEVDGNRDLDGIDCPTATLCTAVGESGYEVSFDPQDPGTPTPVNIDGSNNLNDLACPSDSQCTAVDGGSILFGGTSGGVGGNEVSFDPGDPGNPTAVAIDWNEEMTSVACPSTTQCTAVDAVGREITFDPESLGSPTPTTIDNGADLESVSCPSTTQCTTVGVSPSDEIYETTFNPQNPGSPIPALLPVGDAVSCPTTDQCTAVSGPKEVTFDPTSPGTPTAVPLIDDLDALVAVACPTATQCTAIDDYEEEVTFNPNAPGSPSPNSIDDEPSLRGLACPTTTQCTAVDQQAGSEATFNPLDPANPSDASIRSVGADGIACPSTTDCIAVDADANTLEGDPTGTGAWTLASVSGANSLTAVACPSESECVAVDNSGRETTGTMPTLPPPTNTAVPTISGTVQQGQTLTESHGSWTNNPDPNGYSYQWEDCDSSGQNCSAIANATGQTYSLTSADVRHTIVVQETASNASGPSMLASSAATAVVLPLAPTSTSAPAISGDTTVGQTLSESHATWTNNPTSYTYQWEDCNDAGNNCTAIGGAINQTYPLASTDAGDTIRVVETATNAGGSSSLATSSPTGPVQTPSPPATKPTDSTPPTISGTSTVGSALAATTGTWSGTPPPGYTYQWFRCTTSCAAIPGATASSYTVTSADGGAKIAVAVTATNAAGSTTVESTQIGPITESGPTTAQVHAALAKVLKPSGKTAAIKAIVKAGGCSLSFTAPSAGTLTIDWYATIAHKQVLVASVREVFDAAGRARIKLTLTAKGRKLLRSSKRIKLTTRATFTPSGETATSTSGTATLSG
jgi:hypothetical protein